MKKVLAILTLGLVLASMTSCIDGNCQHNNAHSCYANGC